MATVETKLTRKRLIGAYLSSVFSISLVLLLVGVAALLMVNASNASNYFKESMKLELVFKLDTPENVAQDYGEYLKTQPYTKTVDFISKEQGIQEMTQSLGDDFLKVFDTPPIPVSLDLALKAEYTEGAALDSVIVQIGRNPQIEEVVCQKSLVESVNRNLGRIWAIMAVVIALLVFISYVLIGNTVRLNLHNKRFTVHTMRLVGATKSFIRRPFMLQSLVQGVIASLISMVFLIAVLFVVKRQFVQMLLIFPKSQLYGIMAIMLSSGVLICMLTTFITVSRMVTLRKEELYF